MAELVDEDEDAEDDDRGCYGEEHAGYSVVAGDSDLVRKHPARAERFPSYEAV
jgi:hypothetical protein